MSQKLYVSQTVRLRYSATALNRVRLMGLGQWRLIGSMSCKSSTKKGKYYDSALQKTTVYHLVMFWLTLNMRGFILCNIYQLLKLLSLHNNHHKDQVKYITATMKFIIATTNKISMEYQQMLQQLQQANRQQPHDHRLWFQLQSKQLI